MSTCTYTEIKCPLNWQLFCNLAFIVSQVTGTAITVNPGLLVGYVLERFLTKLETLQKCGNVQIINPWRP